MNKIQRLVEFLAVVIVGNRILFWGTFVLGIVAQFMNGINDLFVVSAVRCFFCAALSGGIVDPALAEAIRYLKGTAEFNERKK
jgi:hypothetical protein